MNNSTTRFPTDEFVWLAILWIGLDMAAALTLLLTFLAADPLQLFRPLLSTALGVLVAKHSLLCGWMLLGNLDLSRKLLGSGGVLLPLFLTVGAFHYSLILVVLCGGVLVLPMLLFPYWLLQIGDYELDRHVAANTTTPRQFTVRQLMFITLLAAVVMGLLRWLRGEQMEGPVFAVVFPILAWLFPLITSHGLLQIKWYPGAAYSAALWACILALPFLSLQSESALLASIMLIAFIGFYVLHLLLMRRLGFRLLKSPSLAQRKAAGVVDAVWHSN